MPHDVDTNNAIRPPRVFPPVYLLAAILAMAALHTWLPGAVVVVSPWRWLGLVPLAAALVLAVSAVRLFRRHQTTIKPGEVSSHMLTGGPYRFTRNPIYVGMVTLLVGIALLMGSAAPWLLVPLFAWIINRNVIPVEEAMLADKFGTEYQQYCANVRRWL